MDKATALKQITDLLGIPAAWLDSLIAFESKWQPAARNPVTGARGLIQFLHSTAFDLGYKNADDLVSKHPTAVSQLLTPVYAYLKQFKPFPTKQSLYMAVFYPKARTWPLTQVFPDSVRAANKGIDTVGDYVNFVEKIAVKKKAFKGALILCALAFTFYAFKRIQKERETLWPRKTEPEASRQ
jgi:hypothetical protein